ncbi:hypothetical protein ACHAXA_010873 [Cyclostephanos tholiformis]|uniref:Uncharacterized protein n=1 Tax=Cyclostephanos tholiformis TaxID=382380 RepID=A0ABD3SCY7_9STRA
MWNKFIGKKKSGDVPGGATMSDSSPTGRGGVGVGATTPPDHHNKSHSAASSPAASASSRRRHRHPPLRAVIAANDARDRVVVGGGDGDDPPSWHLERRCVVRVLVGDVDVSPPVSAAEEDAKDDDNDEVFDAYDEDEAETSTAMGNPAHAHEAPFSSAPSSFIAPPSPRLTSPLSRYDPRSIKEGIDDNDNDEEEDDEEDDEDDADDSNAGTSVDSQATNEEGAEMMSRNDIPCDEDDDDDIEEEEEEDDDDDDEEEDDDDPKDSAAGTNVNKAGGGDDFEASLLLNIGAFPPAPESDQNRDVASGEAVVVAPAAANSLETDRLLRERGGSSGGGVGDSNGAKDPNTLPTSMTSFLDVLTEEQRRTRHRHIPSVDGFRRLYRGEVKYDMARARRCRNANAVAMGAASRKQQRRPTGSDNEEDVVDDDDVDDERAEQSDERRDMDVEEGGAVDDENAGDGDDRDDDQEGTNKARGGEAGAGSAFVAPTKEARRIALGGELAFFLDGAKFADGTRPPNVVDSITTFHPPRPQESTSTKTRLRLRRWEANPEDVDADMSSYRKTVGRTMAELDAARAERLRTEAVSTLVRGHLATHLKNYGVEATAIDEGLGKIIARCVKADNEISVKGVGTRSSGGKGMRDVLATLMTLGKEVKGATKNAGTAKRKRGNAPKDWRAVGVGGVCMKASGAQNYDGRGGTTTTTIPLSCGWLLVGDEVIVNLTGEEGVVVSIDGPKSRTDVSSIVKNTTEMEPGAKSKTLDKNESSSSGSKRGTDCDAMDLDASPNIEEQEATAAASNEKHDSTVTVEPRWGNMIQTALANCVDHDVLAMTRYNDATLVGGRTHDDTGVIKNDGTSSPTSVGQYDDAHTLLPFGSGLVAAPDDLKNYPSVLPLDVLEETVRNAVYGVNKPRVIPSMPSALSVYESRQEEINTLKGKVLQLRNRLSRQKRLRGLNEHSLVAGQNRAKKAEGLLLEMQMDLKNLKERLQVELTELGIGNSAMMRPVSSTNDASGENRIKKSLSSPEEAHADISDPTNVEIKRLGFKGLDGDIGVDGGSMSGNERADGYVLVDDVLEPDIKRARVD